MADSSQTRLGIICAIIASISFSINDASIKFISGGYPLHEVVTFRAGISLIISLAILVPMEGGYRQLLTAKLPLHLLRGLLVVGANSFFFLAQEQDGFPVNSVWKIYTRGDVIVLAEKTTRR